MIEPPSAPQRSISSHHFDASFQIAKRVQKLFPGQNVAVFAMAHHSGLVQYLRCGPPGIFPALASIAVPSIQGMQYEEKIVEEESDGTICVGVYRDDGECGGHVPIAIRRDGELARLKLLLDSPWEYENGEAEDFLLVGFQHI